MQQVSIHIEHFRSVFNTVRGSPAKLAASLHSFAKNRVLEFCAPPKRKNAATDYENRYVQKQHA
jgi:hypothetical protein